jgi:hypothetical protein
MARNILVLLALSGFSFACGSGATTTATDAASAPDAPDADSGDTQPPQSDADFDSDIGTVPDVIGNDDADVADVQLDSADVDTVSPDADDVVDSGDSADTDDVSEEPPWIPPFPDADWVVTDGSAEAFVEASDTCSPEPIVCPAAASGRTEGRANFRKDYWLESYEEYGDPPLEGGRMQSVFIAQQSGALTSVQVNGVELDSIYDPPGEGEVPPFEWYHVWPRQVVAGEPVWLNFHSRQATWTTEIGRAPTFDVSLQAGDDVVWEGTVEYETPAVQLTYVTFSADRQTVYVHARNTSEGTRTVSGLEVQGVESLEHACVPDRTVAPGASVMWTVPLCEPAETGAAWTVVATFDDGSHAVGSGRVIRPFFPIEAWNNTTECPFPGTGGNAEHYEAMRDATFDTIYTHGGVCARCGCDTATLLNEQLPADGWRTFITNDIVDNRSIEITATESVTAVSTGDESDGEIYDDDGTPRPGNKARMSLRSWLRYPMLPTFNGGKTNRHIGTFAGMSDIQGMDFYMAACAPHITPTDEPPQPRSPYDWLVNTRNNHMPNPTWLYSQGLAPAWNRGEGDREIFIQPDPQEILVQGWSAILAGAKGLMWFQSNQDERRRAPERWDAIAEVNQMVARIREWLRTGDITGQAWAPPGTLVDLIRSDGVIVVPVVNTAADVTVDDGLCLQAYLGVIPVPHWIFSERMVDVYLDIPTDFDVTDVFELTPDGVAELEAGSVAVDGHRMRFSEISLSNDTPVRVLILASDATARLALQ